MQYNSIKSTNNKRYSCCIDRFTMISVPQCQPYARLTNGKHQRRACGRQCFQEGPLFSENEMVQCQSLRVSPMGFGTWSWGNRFLWGYSTDMDGELQDMFNLAVSKGINIFDTADSYGTGDLNGRSEQLLGQFIDQYPGTPDYKNNIHIATKLAGYPWRLTPGSYASACKASLARLKMESISLAQLHWSTANYAPLQEWIQWRGLEKIKEQGLAVEVGVSNFGAKQLRDLHKFLDKRGIKLASVQVQYSLVSYGSVQRAVEDCAKELGVMLIAYSPLGLGVLTNKYTQQQLPEGPRGFIFNDLVKNSSDIRTLVKTIAEERGKSAAQVAINWCICKGTVPIPGAKSMNQLKDNLGALGWRLEEGEVLELDKVATNMKGGMLQNVFQTN